MSRNWFRSIKKPFFGPYDRREEDEDDAQRPNKQERGKYCLTRSFCSSGRAKEAIDLAREGPLFIWLLLDAPFRTPHVTTLPFPSLAAKKANEGTNQPLARPFGEAQSRWRFAARSSGRRGHTGRYLAKRALVDSEEEAAKRKSVRIREMALFKEENSGWSCQRTRKEGNDGEGLKGKKHSSGTKRGAFFCFFLLLPRRRRLQTKPPSSSSSSSERGKVAAVGIACVRDCRRAFRPTRGEGRCHCSRRNVDAMVRWPSLPSPIILSSNDDGRGSRLASSEFA